MQYFELYEATVTTIKQIDASYRIGGPATAGLDDGAWVPEMIAYCRERSIPLDFISTHSYSVDAALDECGRSMHRLKADKDCVLKDVRGLRTQVSDSAMPELPILFSEWSTRYTPRDNVHDSYVSAPFILYTLKRCEGYVQSLIYRTLTDIFEVQALERLPSMGGFGLKTIQGLKKAAFCLPVAMPNTGRCIAY